MNRQKEREEKKCGKIIDLTPERKKNAMKSEAANSKLSQINELWSLSLIIENLFSCAWLVRPKFITNKLLFLY